MRQRILQLVWAAGLVAALAAVATLNRAATGGVAPVGRDAAARYGFRLVEAAHASGVDFAHSAPTFELHWGGRVQVQEVNGGSGFSAQNQRRLHFGVGDAAQVDRLRIRWPSGREQTIERPTLDQWHRIVEPE